MISPSTFHTRAIAFINVEEKPHFDKTAYTIKGKIFATLDTKRKSASLRLTEAEQSVYGLIKPVFAKPATGAWGKQGWKVFDLQKVPVAIIREALEAAYTLAAPPVKTKPVKKQQKELKIEN